MSPTIFRENGYRFFFFSREEERMHVHIYCEDGEAKFWLEPEIDIVYTHGLSRRQVNEILKIVKERRDIIADAWREHFKR